MVKPIKGVDLGEIAQRLLDQQGSDYARVEDLVQRLLDRRRYQVRDIENAMYKLESLRSDLRRTDAQLESLKLGKWDALKEEP